MTKIATLSQKKQALLTCYQAQAAAYLDHINFEQNREAVLVFYQKYKALFCSDLNKKECEDRYDNDARTMQDLRAAYQF